MNKGESRLINKDYAIRAICEACYMYKYVGEHYKDCKYYPCDDVRALEAIPEAPTAEAVQGKWMRTEHDDPCYFRCSNCGRMSDEDSDFCPNCGAKMKPYKGGEADD